MLGLVPRGVTVTLFTHIFLMVMWLVVVTASLLSIAVGGIVIVMVLASSSHHILAAIAALLWLAVMCVAGLWMIALYDDHGRKD